MLLLAEVNCSLEVHKKPHANFGHVDYNMEEIMDENWEFIDDNLQEVEQNNTNAYLKQLKDITGLKLLQVDKIEAAYSSTASELGLTTLFLSNSLLKGMHHWTNTHLESKEKKKIVFINFMAFWDWKSPCHW